VKLYGANSDCRDWTSAVATNCEGQCEDRNVGIVETQKLKLPFEPVAPQTLSTAKSAVGDIANRCMQNNWNSISSLETENTINMMTRLARRWQKLCFPCVYPRNLKALIEDKLMTKVCYNLRYDRRKLAEISIRLIPNYKDTGHMAFDRGIKI